MNLFEHSMANDPSTPLADRMRPQTLEDLVGHGEVVGPGSFLRAALEQDAFPSLILWGPPGSGKTTLARLVAGLTSACFEPFSAVLGGVKEVRKIVARARERRQVGGPRTILFVDEIHRFNKAQQDAFLPHVEDGTLTLIGATTENPSFMLNAALLSRCRVVRLEALTEEDLVQILSRAVQQALVPGGALDVTDEALELLAHAADGDARRALTSLEHAAAHARRQDAALDAALVEALAVAAPLRHDRAGDAHYDVVSAFIKSMRGSDPDAALYYLARLLEGGDDPRFICRRLIIFAAEDVGNADPRAVGVAVDGASAFERVGMPEGRIILGQVCTFLACAPKSNAAYKAMDGALAKVRDTGTLPVPESLRNAPTRLQKAMGHGAGYRYPHDHGGWVPDQYLPESLQGTVFYEPRDAGYERHVAERLAQWRRLREAEEGGEGS